MAASNPWHSSTCRLITPVSASVITWPPSLCLCLSFMTCVMRFRVYPDNPGCSNLKASKLITFANTLFPNKITLIVQGLRSSHVFWGPLFNPLGFPGGWFSGKESACQCKKHRFDPWVRKIPWRRKWQPTPVILPGKSHGQRSLVDYSPRGLKESDMTQQLSKGTFNPL